MEKLILNITPDQLSILVAKEVEETLISLGVISPLVTAAEGARICKSRRRFEKFVNNRLLPPILDVNSKKKMYSRLRLLELLVTNNK